jgi:hypothetical protein
MQIQEDRRSNCCVSWSNYKGAGPNVPYFGVVASGKAAAPGVS